MRRRFTGNSERDVSETSPPTISASGRGRCRAPGHVADRGGTSLPVAAGALDHRRSPGGATDILARLIGQWLSERLGQPFVIDNRPGAGTNIATDMVVNAAPDGHTLILVAPAAAINATLYEKLNFNFLRDIAPIAGIVRTPSILEVHPSVPAKSVPETRSWSLRRLRSFRRARTPASRCIPQGV